jgi:hypothetical protein
MIRVLLAMLVLGSSGAAFAEECRLVATLNRSLIVWGHVTVTEKRQAQNLDECIALAQDLVAGKVHINDDLGGWYPVKKVRYTFQGITGKFQD